MDFLKFKKQCLVFGLLCLLTGNISIYATTRVVFPQMSRIAIQEVFDMAEDGDRILFIPGTYDFSDQVFSVPGDYKGAIEIVDKSLIIIGLKQTFIKGAQSIMDGDIGIEGIPAFVIRNETRDKDVTFQGLNLETFLYGIVATSCNSIKIEGCDFNDMHRNGIAVVNAAGNIKILNNSIESPFRGVSLDNLETYQSESSIIECIENKIDMTRNSKLYMGININYFNKILLSKNTITGNNLGGAGILLRASADYDEQNEPYSFITENNISQFRYGVNMGRAHLVSVSNNIITNISKAGIGVYANSDEECTHNQIIGNVIEMDAPSTWDPGNNSFGISTKCSYNYFAHNIVRGSGSGAIFIYALYACIGHHNVFECNNVKEFVCPSGYDHYVFYWGTHDNRFSESWTDNVTYINYGYDSNYVTTIDCER